MEILLVFFSVFEFSVFHKTRLQWILYQEKERGGARNLHITQIPPKIGHVECCWSPPQGGPCSVHLPLANF